MGFIGNMYNNQSKEKIYWCRWLVSGGKTDSLSNGMGAYITQNATLPLTVLRYLDVWH